MRTSRLQYEKGLLPSAQVRKVGEYTSKLVAEITADLEALSKRAENAAEGEHAELSAVRAPRYSNCRMPCASALVRRYCLGHTRAWLRHMPPGSAEAAALSSPGCAEPFTVCMFLLRWFALRRSQHMLCQCSRLADTHEATLAFSLHTFDAFAPFPGACDIEPGVEARLHCIRC